MKEEAGAVAQAYEVFRLVAKDWDTAIEAETTLDAELLDRVFAATLLVLRAYCRPANYAQDGTPKEYLPPQIVKLIANQIDYIHQGYLPSLIREKIQQGSPKIGPHERTDLALALAYIQGVRDEIIDDKHPIKTVAKYYGVTEHSVRRWRRRYDSVSPSDFFHDVDGQELGELLSRRMKKSGLRYKQVGRGSEGRTEFPRKGKKPRADRT